MQLHICWGISLRFWNFMMFGFNVLLYLHLISCLSRATVLSNLNGVFYIVLFSFNYIKYLKLFFFFLIRYRFNLWELCSGHVNFFQSKLEKHFLMKLGAQHEQEFITEPLKVNASQIICSSSTLQWMLTFIVQWWPSVAALIIMWAKEEVLTKPNTGLIFTKSWFLNLLVLCALSHTHTRKHTQQHFYFHT